ncbi:hypothetical protein AABM38_12445 [Heyndrickxia sp. MSNUG]|uniref:hypothetical protein n=1 Tax=Heyndrickxia sp. MSNUG TaxID=3136677 RepID=UPI003C30C4AF
MREHNADRAGSLLVTTAVILLFASVPIGIFLVAFIHQSFYLKNNYLFFDTPMSSYVTMVAMFLIIAVLLIFIAIYLFKSYESKKRSFILVLSTLITIVITIIGGYLSLDNYFYMDKEGLYYDDLWGLEKTAYSWDEITAMKQINKKENGTLSPEKVIFTYGEDKIELPLTHKLRNEIDPVIGYIENAKGVKLVLETRTVE